jgi:hypothetical protein
VHQYPPLLDNNNNNTAKALLYEECGPTHTMVMMRRRHCRNCSSSSKMYQHDRNNYQPKAAGDLEL